MEMRHTVGQAGGSVHRIDLPPSHIDSSAPLTGSNIGLLDVIPPTPPLEEANLGTNVSVRPQEDYGFPDVVAAIDICKPASGSSPNNFLKPWSPFQDGEGSAYEDRDIEQASESSGTEGRTSRSKALLIGIKYDWSAAPVEGAHNDVEDMKAFLVDHRGWLEDDISVLKDDGKSTFQPTRNNIISSLQHLVEDSCAGDKLFLYFSGHGGQITDTDGDEDDGLDEVIFSCDKQYIVDDELHDILVKPLPAGCKLMALFDCCSSGTSLDLPITHSSPCGRQLSALSIPITLSGPRGCQSVSPTSGNGSMLDLPRQYNYPSVNQESLVTSHVRLKSASLIESKLHRKWTAGDVIMWSSCNDSERSYEVVASTDREMKGAMTHAFIECLKDRKHQTYRELLDAVDEMLVVWGCPQNPIMSTAHFVNMADIVSL